MMILDNMNKNMNKSLITVIVVNYLINMLFAIVISKSLGFISYVHGYND